MQILRFKRGFATTVAASALAGSTLVLAAPAAEAAPIVVRLRAAVSDLTVATETRSGYARSEFRHWADLNGDCQDTRDEVLAAESKIDLSGCDIVSGRWVSYYDRAVWTKASDVDIDHLVPLAEAWDSGARTWTSDTRKRYANDLGDSRTLVAVTDNVNQSKGDRDPADWLPRYSRCRYVAQWVAVKLRWSLKVDSAEQKALARVAGNCDNVKITVRKAKVVKGTSGSGGTSTGTDPRFPYCKDAKAAGYGPYHQGKDPEYDWYTDADSDGIVCE